MYLDPDIREDKVKELIGSARYSDNVNAIGDSLSKLNRVSEILINAFRNTLCFLNYSLSLSYKWRKIRTSIKRIWNKHTLVQVEFKS